MTFDDFAMVLTEYFDLEPGTFSYSTELHDDMGFDSIMMVECVVMLEDLAGHSIDPMAIESLTTVGSVYDFAAQFLTPGAVSTTAESATTTVPPGPDSLR